MLQLLSRYPTFIAWFFVSVFYLQLILVPAAANATENKMARYYPATGKKRTFLTNYNTGNRDEIKFLKNSLSEKRSITDAGKIAGPETAVAFEKADAKETVAIGPTQPEMATFQSVNANNLVDLFTGDFSYNIPLLDVGGYPVNLHYQSGISMEQEASWVGLGWNINPGVISRNMRGLPDDFKGGADQVKKTQSVKDNKTFGANIGGDIELIGFPLNFKLEMGLFHNTYKGWGTEIGINAAINAGRGAKGPLNGSLGLSNNSQSGLDISPSLGFKLGSEDTKAKGNVSIGTNFNSRAGIQSLQVSGEVRQTLYSEKKTKYSIGTSMNAGISFSKPSYTPSITMPFTSTQIAGTFKVGGEMWGMHPSAFVRGYLSIQKIEDADTMQSIPAYGYLNYDAAGNNQRVLLDFNREKDIPYTNNSPHIAMPIYTYDTYSISGEGTGGMFRPYRGDIGAVFDNAMSSKSNSDKVSIDLGFGSVFHAGTDFTDAESKTTSGPWISNNFMYESTRFQSRDGLFENVYFKNPGEKTAVNKAYLEAIGGENLVRVGLTPAGDEQHDPYASATRNLIQFNNGEKAGVTTISPQTKRTVREKRTQMISYLTAEEAAIAGLDKRIKFYRENVFPAGTCEGFDSISRFDGIRQKHHISEMTVLNDDGKRYVYGIPVYNISQTEVTMAVPQGDNNTGLVNYDSSKHNTIHNDQGKDGYFSKEELPPYAHSYLLSGILSADYVDLTGDGITMDDQGDAVKFNYSQIYTAADPFKWRVPFQRGTAFFNEGLKTDNRDDKGSYTYGKREVWYLNSIESKTMIATFRLDDMARHDGKGVNTENGGDGGGQMVRRLKEINLYAKADYAKMGDAAKPIKTVHFGYSYKLTPGVPGAPNSEVGKLTLDSVWFTYNDRGRKVKNAYKFNYHASNPGYDHKMTDRWGTYKHSKANPGGPTSPMPNADYSYSLQEGNGTWNKDSADKYAASWTLTNIKLPSGGEINVAYESDDYAYVQNKRAMQFYRLEGFGQTYNGTRYPVLYFPTVEEDCRFAFVRVTEPVTNAAQIRSKYLEGVDKLFFKLTVKMPEDAGNFGSGSEIVPCYAEFEDVGVVAGDNTLIWVKLKPIAHNKSAPATAAFQFLRLNLPHKAYSFSEPGDNLDLRTALGMIASARENFEMLRDGFDDYARKASMVQELTLDKSFVRLNNPNYRKFGGGLRVKRVEVKDQWNKMTGGKDAIYGQDYKYTTEIEVNGQKKEISSGVASYEPVVGNDENPFRVPFKLYTDKVGALAPTDYLYSEEPFAETFFPSPSVGYSKVTVQSIHHTRKSASGITQSEFYTTKDFPTLVEITPINNESKKTFNPKLQEVFRIDAKNYVTISQGFKVELNDMNGKLKSTIFYGQTDLKNPVSYTYNYYRLENDHASRKKLSNKVAVIHNASGEIDEDAEIGKEVEIMMDVREQTTESGSRSAEANFDLANVIPPIGFGSMIPIPTNEVNRFRSIAVLKVVNRYAILDSVVQIEKGSKISTRNLVFDGETGNVLLSRTNNMFDDPVYNFNYPAHWAYTGMQGAYKNLGAIVKNVEIRKGIPFIRGTSTRMDLSQYLESGDEVLVKVHSVHKLPADLDPCDKDYYSYTDLLNKDSLLWVINGRKGIEQETGLFFIDRAGMPVSLIANSIKVLRSGKRNMSSVSVGAVTTMESPIKVVSGKPKIIIHDTTKVLSASAVRFKDTWKVEQVLRQYDSCVEFPGSGSVNIPIRSFRNWWYFQGPNNGQSFTEPNCHYVVAAYHWKSHIGSPGGYNLMLTRSLLKLDMSAIPDDAVIKNAKLNLFASVPEGLWTEPGYAIPDLNYNYGGGNNPFVGQLMPFPLLHREFDDVPWLDWSVLDTVSQKVLLPFRDYDNIKVSYGNVDIKNIIQPLVGKPQDFQNLILKMQDEWPVYGHDKDRFMSYRSSYFHLSGPPFPIDNCAPSNATLPRGTVTPDCVSYISVDFDYGSRTCYKVCRLEYLNEDTLNPYLVGMAGNWRPDTAYTYYSDRRESFADIKTNIRKDGLIKDFVPYWKMDLPDSIVAMPDPSRWVWNSKSTMHNRKGMELENKDPLDRFNAAIYGFSKTLPVATAQNSKNREITFEGFEDQEYRTDSCNICYESGWIKIDALKGKRNFAQSHSGRTSLEVFANKRVSKDVKIDQDLNSEGPILSFKVDSVLVYDTIVNPQGTGMTAKFGVWSANLVQNGCLGRTISSIEWWPQTYLQSLSVDYGNGAPPAFCATNYFAAQLYGELQVEITDWYYFKVVVDDEYDMWFNGDNRIFKIRGEAPPEGTAKEWQVGMKLYKGQAYPIFTELLEITGSAGCKVYWSRAGATAWVQIPLRNQYPSREAFNNANTTQITPRWCVALRPIKQTNGLIDEFTPKAGSKMVVGAWVKEDVLDITGYKNSSIRISYTGSAVTEILKPSGKIIDGWQRIEAVIEVPPGATSMKYELVAGSSASSYFDDLRIHPFQANMKSYVYDPFNIRLLAEMDENNYATFYEYDDEGTLVRVKKETERGVKTIKETRSALIKKENL